LSLSGRDGPLKVGNLSLQTPLKLSVLSFSSSIKISMSKLSTTKLNNDNVLLYRELVLGGNGRSMLLCVRIEEHNTIWPTYLLLRRSRLIRALLDKVVNLLLEETLCGLILGAHRFLRARLLLGANHSMRIVGRKKSTRMQRHLKVIGLIAAEDVRAVTELTRRSRTTHALIFLLISEQSSRRRPFLAIY
jgi:hypothetical protein